MKYRAVVFGLCLCLLTTCTVTFAQTQTTAEISGIVTDASGAVVPKASITVTSKETGTQRKGVTNNDGYYAVPLLPLGTYSVVVRANGFQAISREDIVLEIGHSIKLDFKLQVGSVNETVTVQAATSLIEPSNPNMTTTLTARQLNDLPNPGGDITYLGALAPGAIMNVNSSAFNYAVGTSEFNGLASVANEFNIDGLDASQPWENLNRSGASGLQLGLNAIQEATINTQSYGADQGRLGASQYNFVTKSGTNQFHGNAYEIWNGSSMNATNFFLNALGEKKPFSNVNEFGASVGGPILKNKLFFFTDFEGIRIVLPVVLHSTVPTSDFQQYILQQLPKGGTDSFGNVLPPQPGEVAAYQSAFNLIGNATGTPFAETGCPFDGGGFNPTTGVVTPPLVPNAGTGCAVARTVGASPQTSETLWTLKTDYIMSQKDSFWFRFQLNRGNNVSLDPVNSLFNIYAKYPTNTGGISWTHTFSPNLVNEFVSGFSYQNRIHSLASESAATSAIPIGFDPSGFSSIGGALVNIPYGNINLDYQFNDNLSWTKGKHGFKFGTELIRFWYNSAESAGYLVVPLVETCDLPEFIYGASCEALQNFISYTNDHIASIEWDNYAMDTFKVTPKLTVNYGLRLAWLSNPVSEDNVIARLNPTFGGLDHDVNTPLNQAILGNQHHMFASTYPFKWEPRVAIAYQWKQNTTFRVGGGMFSNPLFGFIPSYMDENAPSDVNFTGGLFGPAGGVGVFSGGTNSVESALANANAAFQAGFKNGVVSCVANNPPPNCLPVIGFTSFESQKQKFPSIYQWSAGVQHQFSTNFALTVNYVGTRSIDGFYSDSPNAYQVFCQGCFNNYPYGAPPDARFGDIFPFETGTSSNYHALQVSVQKRMSHDFTFQANYTYSHCLDEITNGGVIIFNANENFGMYNGELKQLYASCDFDVRHSVNGSYIYELPFHFKNSFENAVLGGWQVAGTVFLRGGFPFSVFSTGAYSGILQGYPTLYANRVQGQPLYTSANVAGVTLPGTIQYVNPYAFQSVIDPTTGDCVGGNTPTNCQNGTLGRNTLRAPGFKWTDLDVSKRFKLHESLGMKLDVQLYNLFNHPNFGFPANAGYPGNLTAGVPNLIGTLSGFGAINNTASPSTGLLGGGLGGDSSVRMIALKLAIEF